MHNTTRQRSCLCLALTILLVLGVAACRAPATPQPHNWPDASWRPYDPNNSPFNWAIPANPHIVSNSGDMVDSLLKLSGCNPSDISTYQFCKPNNLVAHDDHASGGGWPTYYLLSTDPEITVACVGGPCPFPT